MPLRGWLLVALLAATLGAIPAVADGWLSYRPAPAPASSPFASVALSERPPGFWHTAGQALAIAESQPATRALLRRYPGIRVTVFPGVGGQVVAGQWTVRLWPPGSGRAASSPVALGHAGQLVYIADRSGTVLPTSAWAWSRPWTMGSADPTWRARIELFSALLAGVLLVLFWDARRPRSLRNFDLLALLSFGLSFAFFEQGRVLASVPLQYPPLVYLAGRLLRAGVARTAHASEPAAWASSRLLWIALAALVAVRIAYNLVLGTTVDVAYASVLGANGIHHGLPLYWPGQNHLDAYGPAMYLAYLPFELVFPDPGWVWNWLAAAHAATITFDLLTIGGLLLLGRRLAGAAGAGTTGAGTAGAGTAGAGTAGARLGLVLAVAWAATPWTLHVLDASSNDGLMALLLVGLLLAGSSPLLRGSVLGWAVAAKFAPLALAGLFCFAGDRPRRARTMIVFAAALSITTAVLILAFLPPQGLSLFWSKTLGFQLARHSFMGIWDQYPWLEPLRSALMATTAALAAAVLIWPRLRDLYQLAAFSGALIILLELALRFWSYMYVDWFLPAVLVVVLGGARARAGSVPVAADPLDRERLGEHVLARV